MRATERRARLRGLYAITPDEPSLERLIARVAAAIDGGALLVQYRAKNLAAAQRAAQARALVSLCRPRGVPLIVNDDPDLAVAVGADGVHLGRDDADPATVRRQLPEAIIGVSCYDQPALARQAAAAGADYVGIGSLFPSGTKPRAVPASLSLLAQARAAGGLPVAGIGGIRPDNAASVVAAGADMIAVIGSLFDTPDVARAARELSLTFATDGSPHVRTQPAAL